jgi:hypothetical protein
MHELTIDHQPYGSHEQNYTNHGDAIKIWTVKQAVGMNVFGGRLSF